MNAILVFTCLIIAVLGQEKYNSELDGSFDVAQVLENKRLLLSYTRCLLDKGPCTPEVKQVKDKLPEALATKCAKCTERQKEFGKKLAMELKRTRPDIWQQLVNKYDPKGKYQEAFQELLSKA